MIENEDYFLKKRESEERCVEKVCGRQFSMFIKDAEPIKEFDIDLYYKVIEKITVFKGRKSL